MLIPFISKHPIRQGLIELEEQFPVSIDHDDGGSNADAIENKSDLDHGPDWEIGCSFDDGIGSRGCREHEGVGAAQGGRQR